MEALKGAAQPRSASRREAASGIAPRPLQPARCSHAHQSCRQVLHSTPCRAHLSPTTLGAMHCTGQSHCSSHHTARDCSEAGWGGKSHKSALQHPMCRQRLDRCLLRSALQSSVAQILSPYSTQHQSSAHGSANTDCPALSWLQLGLLSSFPAALCCGLRLSTELTTPIFWLLLLSAYTELRNLGTSWAPLRRWGQPRCVPFVLHIPSLFFFPFFVPLNCLYLNPCVYLFFPSILSPTPVKGEGAKDWEVLS